MHVLYGNVDVDIHTSNHVYCVSHVCSWFIACRTDDLYPRIRETIKYSVFCLRQLPAVTGIMILEPHSCQLWHFIGDYTVRTNTGKPFGNLKGGSHWLHLSAPGDATLDVQWRKPPLCKTIFMIEISNQSKFFFGKLLCTLQSHCVSSYWVSWSYYGSQFYGRV